ncbi:expressed unknown protein [Seminavis robusta]|uniref:Uncharacterized protein n=1 Tax=Seminavis robusta TaxID=568900 RepID=A0A9N8HBF0_9STRA|nr:expressed unknown protein [Seminavis robusta]|eukprot:Sro258_g101160.1 n/a (957) ;mRNA; r:62021-64998
MDGRDPSANHLSPHAQAFQQAARAHAQAHAHAGGNSFEEAKTNEMPANLVNPTAFSANMINADFVQERLTTMNAIGNNANAIAGGGNSAGISGPGAFNWNANDAGNANAKKSLAMPNDPAGISKGGNSKKRSEPGDNNNTSFMQGNTMMDPTMAMLQQQQEQLQFQPNKRFRDMNTAISGALSGNVADTPRPTSNNMFQPNRTFPHQQQSNQPLGFSPVPAQAQPLPRAPTSPGNFNVGAVQDFADANAALRRNLATLHQQQNQQQPAPIPSFNGSGGNFNGVTGFNNGNGNPLFSSLDDQSNMNLTASNPQQNQLWASELLLRSNQTAASGMNGINVNNSANMNLSANSLGSSAAGAFASGGGGSAGGTGNAATGMDGGNLTQLHLLRQQQERMLQLDQQERLRQLDQQINEEAVMRRQLQLLRRNSALPGGGGAGGPGGNLGFSQSHQLSPADVPSSSTSLLSGISNAGNSFGTSLSADTSLGNNMMFQQQFPQQQLLQQQQQQFGLMSQQQQQQSQQQLGFPNSLDGTSASGRFRSVGRGLPLPETSLERTGSSASAGRQSAGQTPAFRRTSSLSSTIARATPMLGPIAPPVPPPPPESQMQYLLPPIEEGETRHYDQRVHVPLAMEEDQNWLSEFQCFVRKELLQVFRASHQDVKIRVASKKVYFQQVGIRCRHCAHWKPSTRAIRSSAFPSSIRQLYQSFTMMLRDHFGNCPAIPTEKKERFLALKRNNTQGASDSMRYWIYSAVKLGMVDSDCGIVLNEQTQAAARNKPPFGTASFGEGETNNTALDSPPRLLVNPEDLEQNVIESEFLYTLLTQYQLIRLLPTECIGNRKSLRPGVPGLGCRYCCQAGRLGLSRVFPAKKKQLPAQIQDLYDHVRRCNLCPSAVKEEVVRMKEDRDQQRRASNKSSSSTDGEEMIKMKIIDEDDKGFVELLWQRLGHRSELATPIAPSS